MTWLAKWRARLKVRRQVRALHQAGYATIPLRTIHQLQANAGLRPAKRDGLQPCCDFPRPYHDPRCMWNGIA